RIEIIKAPRYGIVGEKKEACERTGPERAGGERNIQFRVVEEGRRSPPGDTVQVRIRREGRRDELRRVQIGRIVTAEMDFPHAGQNIVEIEAGGAPGELTPLNHR